MVVWHLRLLRLWVRDDRAAGKSLAAIAALAFFAGASEASAQANPADLVLGWTRPLSWIKHCDKPAGSTNRMCFTSKDSRSASGELMGTVAIVEVNGGQRKLFTLRTPDGVALQQGAWLLVDRDQPWAAPSVNCMASIVSGYVALCDVTTDLIERMKGGQVLLVQSTQVNGRALNVQVDLPGFARAHDGPPTDPNAFRELQRRSLEQQRKSPNEWQKPIRDDTLQPHLRPWN
jgi:invasion protein IalB